MNCFPWINLTSVLIHLKYRYYNNPSLELHCLPRHLSQISPWPTKTPLQRNPHHVLHLFPYSFLPHSTTRHNYWIYQTIRQAKPIKFIIKLYTNDNTPFSQPYLCIEPPLQSPTKIRSPTFFSPPYSTLTCS